MSNKDFDIDFDFDEAYGFDDDSDGKQEAYDDNTNPEILSRRSSGGSFDADGDLDDFLNMGSAPQVSQEPQARRKTSGRRTGISAKRPLRTGATIRPRKWITATPANMTRV
mgnify:CR=1 FL=1